MTSSAPPPSPLPYTAALPLPLSQQQPQLQQQQQQQQQQDKEQATPSTASLSSLPPECLEHILAYHRSDLTLLHALLLVNRTFFQLTVPLLYQSPFLLIKASDHDRLPYEKFKRQVKLLWLLLSSVHHLPWVREELPPFSEEFPVLWNPALEERQVLAILGGGGSSSGDANRGSGKSIVSQESGSIGSDATKRLDGKKNRVSVRFLTVDYLNYYTHHNHSSFSDALPTLFPSLICYHMDQWSSSKDMIRIRATIERALLMHRPEGIVSLAVPITRVKAVQEAVAAAVAEKASSGVATMGVGTGTGLRRLRRVEFYDIRQEFSVEHVLAFLDSLRRTPSSPSSSGTGAGTMLLTEIKIGGPSDYGQIGKRSLYTILQHLSSSLKVIDLTDWRGAVMDLDQIPTEAVEVLHLRLDRMVADSDSSGPKVVEGFLKKARKLKDLQICIGPGQGGLFRWAVERRRRRESAALLQQSRGSQQSAIVCRIDKEERRSLSSGEADTDDSTGDDNDDDDDEDEDEDDEEDEEAYLVRRGGSPTGMSWVDQSNNNNNSSSSSSGEGGLQKLSLAGETPSVLWGLLGATTAFYDRLEVLTASSWKQPHCATPTDTPITAAGQGYNQLSLDAHGHEHQDHEHGHGAAHHTPGPAAPQLYWSAMMTRLVHLDLKGEIASVSLDMRSLAQAPVLQRLKLDTYKSEIEPALMRVSELLDSVSGTVCELELVGPWFVTDWDLERMSRILVRLRRLRLSHCKTRLEEGEIVGEKGGEEEEEEKKKERVVRDVSAPRIPDYLLAAMPMQQDIVGPSASSSPAAPVSSRTRSHTSGKKQQQHASTSSSRTRPLTAAPSSSSSPTSAAPSSRYLSARGLVHAVEQMTDLHYLHIGILVSSKPPPFFANGSSSSSSSSSGAGMSPWDTLAAATAYGPDTSAGAGKGKVDDEDEEEDGEENMLCLNEKSLLKAFGAQKGSESRAFPLEVEVQECRTF
jgi:hypothetical protein